MQIVGFLVQWLNYFTSPQLKCVKYWPDEKETEQYGNLDVELDGEEVFSDYTLRHLKVSHVSTVCCGKYFSTYCVSNEFL